MLSSFRLFARRPFRLKTSGFKLSMAMLLGYFRHGATLALAFGAAVLAIAAAEGAITFTIWQALLGAVLFYISEYGMHRFAFHAPPAPWPFVRTLQHRLHYDHHVDPARLDLLFLPLWFLVPNLGVTAIVVGFVLGKAAVGSVMFGIFLAILHYEWVHYVAHIPYQPRTAIGRWMKTYHLRHHFVSEKEWFGVSNPTLDVVFGTFKDPKQVGKSATVRNLNN